MEVQLRICTPCGLGRFRRAIHSRDDAKGKRLDLCGACNARYERLERKLAAFWTPGPGSPRPKREAEPKAKPRTYQKRVPRSVSPRLQARRDAAASGAFVCECGERFARRQGASRHANQQRHKIVKAPPYTGTNAAARERVARYMNGAAA